MSYSTHSDGFEISQVGPRVVAAIVVLVVLITLLVSSTHVVEPGYRGVRITLGKVDPAFIEEGLTFKIPLIQRVDNILVKQITTQGKAPTFSKDLQTVEIIYDVLYRIPEDQVVTLRREYFGNVYESILKPRVQEQMKQVCAQYRAEDLVKEREQVKIAVFEGVRRVIGELIEIRDLTITNIDLTDELEAEIERKQMAEQQAQRAEYELQRAVKEAEIEI
ncbi:MAG: prohibitin family protein, partial [Verrucomicrobiota bacterium]